MAGGSALSRLWRDPKGHIETVGKRRFRRPALTGSLNGLTGGRDQGPRPANSCHDLLGVPDLTPEGNLCGDGRANWFDPHSNREFGYGYAMAGKSLQEELGKKKPFESPEKEAMLNIARTSDLFQNRLGKLFREFGLTGSQHNVLRILRGEGRPMQCMEIRRRMIQVTPAMTGLLSRLENDGFVTRTRCEQDGRVIHVDLTAKARNVLQKIDGPLMNLYGECLGHLSRTELEQLSSLLEKARKSLTS